MFMGLTEDICMQAWKIVLASVEYAAKEGVTNKQAGTIVVLDPAYGTVLFQAHVDDTHPNANEYHRIALAKAHVCWKTKLSSRVVQQSAPHLYEVGMTKWGGGVIENGLVVSFSGVQAVYDEAIAWSVLHWIVAICQNEMTKPDGTMAEASSYVGGLSPLELAAFMDAAGAEVERQLNEG